MKNVYMGLCVLGVLLPYGAFVPWLIENGLDIGLLFSQILNDPLSLFAWSDVLISAIALILFIRIEGGRQKMNYLWAPVLGTCVVGVSLGLPLFLLMREMQYQSDKTKIAS